jgi:hypothetical protein
MPVILGRFAQRTLPVVVCWGRGSDLSFDIGFSSHGGVIELIVQDPQYLLLLFFLLVRTVGALKFLTENCWL